MKQKLRQIHTVYENQLIDDRLNIRGFISSLKGIKEDYPEIRSYINSWIAILDTASKREEGDFAEYVLFEIEKCIKNL